MHISSNQRSLLVRNNNQNTHVAKTGKVMGGIDHWGLIIIAILASIIFAVIFLSILKDYGIIRGLAGATGASVSTLIAFRWVWSRRYGWEQYLLSLRPMFQIIAFIYLILGPLPTLLGLPKYLHNRGVDYLYWLLYLATPLAFLSYEFGYETGLGRKGSKIKLPDFRKSFYSPNLMMVGTFFAVVVIYLIIAQTVGFSGGAGLGHKLMEQNELIIAAALLLDGLIAVTISLAVINLLTGKHHIELISISILFLTFILIVTMHSRTRAIIAIIIAMSAIQLVRKINYVKIAIYSILLFSLVYFVTTAIRRNVPADINLAGVSVTDRLSFSKKALMGQESATSTETSFWIDVGYRVDAFDLSAAILDKHENESTPYMWGEEVVIGAYQAVPSMLAIIPKEDHNPKGAIIDHFTLQQFDQLTNLFSTAVADAGIMGIPIIFLAVGFFHSFLWRHFTTAKNLGILSSGTKYAYLAIIPLLLLFETYSGTYFAIIIRSGVIYTLVFSSLIVYPAIFRKPSN
jgi:hypothetical protein